MEESVFRINKWPGIIRFIKNDADVFTFEEDDSFVLVGSIAGNELELYSVPVDPPEETQEEQAKDPPM